MSKLKKSGDCTRCGQRVTKNLNGKGKEEGHTTTDSGKKCTKEVFNDTAKKPLTH